MAKIQIKIVKGSRSYPDMTETFQNKAKHRINKANLSASDKLNAVEKLRDFGKIVKNAELVDKNESIFGDSEES